MEGTDHPQGFVSVLILQRKLIVSSQSRGQSREPLVETGLIPVRFQNSAACAPART
jgi:hypothetical protein